MQEQAPQRRPLFNKLASEPRKKQDKDRADFTEYWASEHSAATLENMLLVDFWAVFFGYGDRRDGM